jgi:FemAB-related protein (PEP-CTERM system-associated)
MAKGPSMTLTEGDIEMRRSGLTVKPYDPTIAESWDRFVYRHSQASFFHLTGWKRVIEKTFRYKASYYYCERDGTLVGIAPVFDFSNWLVGHCHISVPLAAYGGVCGEDADSGEILVDHVKRAAAHANVDFLELRDRNGETLSGFNPNKLYVTFNAPLLPNTEANFKRLPKDTRYMIRKAEKKGLRAQFGAEQMNDFYDLFAQSMKRLGTPVFPKILFQNLIGEFPNHSQLMLVYNGTKPVAGVLSFLFRDTILPYYAGASDEATVLAANNFMYWELIKWAGEHGFKTFDFGRSKKGTGSFAFKSQWNMNVEPLSYQVFLVKRKTIPNFSPVNPKFEMAIRFWRNLPLPVTKWLGPAVVRLFP